MREVCIRPDVIFISLFGHLHPVECFCSPCVNSFGTGLVHVWMTAIHPAFVHDFRNASWSHFKDDPCHSLPYLLC